MVLSGGIKLYNPRLFFSSDHHFSHVNMIKYENRPFKSVEEMNEKLIFNHNQRITDNDVCIFLGDLYLRGGKEGGRLHYLDFLNRMNGRITIIKGNHDFHSNHIIDPIQKATLSVSGLRVLCVHDPINGDTMHDVIIHGHLHSKSFLMEFHKNNKIALCVNVGVDVPEWKFRPVPWTKIYEIYQQWKCGKIIVPVYDKEAVKKQRELRRKQK